MSWFKALFAQGDEGIRHWTRLKFQRGLKQSASSTSFERRLAALASTIEARNAINGITAFTMEDCIIESAPFAMHSDQIACDILEEYLVCRATGKSERRNWLEYEINRGLEALLDEKSPQFVHLKGAVVENYRETGAIWPSWLTFRNVSRIQDFCSDRS